MHILMVSRGVLPVGKRAGGAEHVCYELAKRLADEGDDVVLVSSVDDTVRSEAPDRLRIEEVGTPRRAGPMSFGRWLCQHVTGNVRVARRALEVVGDPASSIDVVHSHGALATILMAWKLRRAPTPVPILYTEHDATPWSCRYRRLVERVVRRSIYREVNLRACRAATSVVTNFPTLGDELASRSMLSRAHFTTVPNGVDDAPRGGAASTPRLDTDRFFLFVGALTDRKAPDVLLRSMSRATSRCVIVGDGPMRPSLETLATRLGIEERVEFKGAVEPAEVARLQRAAMALVLPSVSEGVPLVAVEAIRAGTPVIASRLDGISTVVEHGVNGLLVEPGDERALAAALCAAEQDEALLATLAAGAAARAPSVLEWAQVASQLRVLYGLLSESAERPAMPGIVGADASHDEVLALPDGVGLPWETFDAQQWRRAA